MSEDVRFNVLNHVNVPLHEILPAKELDALLTKYSIVKEQLPKIKTGDPAVQVISGKAGDVVKITRDSETAGKAVAYRLVVEGF